MQTIPYASTAEPTTCVSQLRRRKREIRTSSSNNRTTHDTRTTTRIRNQRVYSVTAYIFPLGLTQKRRSHTPHNHTHVKEMPLLFLTSPLKRTIHDLMHRTFVGFLPSIPPSPSQFRTARIINGVGIAA